MATLRGWQGLPRDQLLKAFEAGNFAGVEEMRRSERLFERVAPMGVNDIMMAVQYRCAGSEEVGATDCDLPESPELPRLLTTLHSLPSA